MMKAIKVPYLQDVEYIYDDNDEQIAVRHTDTGEILVESDSPYTEEEIRAALWPQE